MTSAQRRATLAVCLIVGLTLLVSAGLTFLVAPMAKDLGLGDDVVEDILAIPSVAALVAVFSAGQLGDRLGHRKALVIASLGFSVGAVILALAGGTTIVQLGLACCAASAVTMQIVGVGLLQQATIGGSSQTSAFTTYGMVFPLAFLAFPVATAAILQVSNWRLIPLIWVIAGVLILIITLVLVERTPPSQAASEWVTPLLAGISLAAAARAFAEIGHVRPDPLPVLLGLAVSVAAGLGWWVVSRRLRQASFDPSVIAGRTMRVLLVAVALVSLVGLLTFVSIALEFFYDLTAYQAALAIIPAQLGAVIGAKVLATRAINRWGGFRAARYLMFALAITMLPLQLVRTDTPVWYLVSVATVFSFIGMAAITVLNAEVMRRAPRARTGAVSAFRTAASSIGGALGVGILGTVIISSLQVDVGVSQVSSAQAGQLATSLRIVGALASMIALAGWLALTLVERGSSAEAIEAVAIAEK